MQQDLIVYEKFPAFPSRWILSNQLLTRLQINILNVFEILYCKFEYAQDSMFYLIEVVKKREKNLQYIS